MRSVFMVLIVVGSCFLSVLAQAQAPRVLTAARGEFKGAVCVYNNEAGFDRDVKLKNGKVVVCGYGCLLVEGGAICQDYPCQYIVCNEPPGSDCSNPDGPEPGLLRTTASSGICDPTGEKAGIPGECYYPEVVIDCGSAEACVSIIPGRDFCQYLPPKKGRR